jgi:adenylate kinase
VDDEAEREVRSSRRVVLLGAPGCGKGTQACFLAGEMGVPAISTGEMLRSAVDEGNELGRQVAGVMAAGGLVNDELMADVVRDRLSRPDAAAGFVLDGYPRTAGQCETLEAILSELGGRIDGAVLLEVPEGVLVERALGRGRADDREEVIRERLRVYGEKTAPVIDFYRDRGLLAVVDGNVTVGEVTAAVLAVLGER